MKWGVTQDDTCLFCDEHETLQHLFFKCKVVAQRLRSELILEGAWVRFVRTLRFRGGELALCLTTAIYHIWAARNKRHLRLWSRTVTTLSTNVLLILELVLVAGNM
ncbi:hypothetical protein LIER_33930 [Lithospermum erythrorhizon]|uniref:Reverse transcriptase zinc-binding domain-containing protein n=1 Tax=Lithospermum erythrorhizon TaxID=34254 RepID=A0AAV3S228_LITER